MDAVPYLAFSLIAECAQSVQLGFLFGTFSVVWEGAPCSRRNTSPGSRANWLPLPPHQPFYHLHANLHAIIVILGIRIEPRLPRKTNIRCAQCHPGALHATEAGRPIRTSKRAKGPPTVHGLPHVRTHRALPAPMPSCRGDRYRELGQGWDLIPVAGVQVRSMSCRRLAQTPRWLVI